MPTQLLRRFQLQSSASATFTISRCCLAVFTVRRRLGQPCIHLARSPFLFLLFHPPCPAIHLHHSSSRCASDHPTSAVNFISFSSFFSDFSLSDRIFTSDYPIRYLSNLVEANPNPIGFGLGFGCPILLSDSDPETLYPIRTRPVDRPTTTAYLSSGGGDRPLLHPPNRRPHYRHHKVGTSLPPPLGTSPHHNAANSTSPLLVTITFPWLRSSNFSFRFFMDWAGLHVEILVSILEKVRLIEDFASFGCVCKSWYEASRNKLQYLHPQIPWLMLPDGDNHQKIYSICRDNLLTRNLCVSEMSKRKCIGLNYGWILTVSRTGEMNLVHPLSRSQIQLPNQGSHRLCCHEIAALSANPLESSSDFAIMITHCRGLGLRYWKSGDQQWTKIKTIGYDYRDLIYFQDRFYVLDYNSRVCIFSVSNLPDPIIVDLGFTYHTHVGYIVESNGDLLFVSRLIDYQNYQSSEDEEEDIVENSEDEEELDLESLFVSLGVRLRNCQSSEDEEEEEEEEIIVENSEDEEEEIVENSEDEEELDLDSGGEGEVGSRYGKDFHYTLGFLVYKLDLINGSYEEIWSLGDFAIFVGHNTSIALNSLEFPGLFKSDHIYFTDDYRFESEIDCSGKDMGFFNMEEGEITRFKVETKLLKRHSPFWFIHSL